MPPSPPRAPNCGSRQRQQYQYRLARMHNIGNNAPPPTNATAIPATTRTWEDSEPQPGAGGRWGGGPRSRAAPGHNPRMQALARTAGNGAVTALKAVRVAR